MTAARRSPALLLLSQEFYPEQVASGKSLTELGEQLVELGVELEVLCGRPTYRAGERRVPETVSYRGMTIRRVGGSRLRSSRLLARGLDALTFSAGAFVRLLRSDPDVPLLVNTSPPWLPLVACAAAAVTGRRYVVRVGDIYPETLERLGILRSRSFVARTWRWLDRVAHRRAERVVVLGRCMEAVLRARGRETDRARIEIVHVWADDRAIRSAAPDSAAVRALRTRWGIEGRFVVLYSGNMGRSHDIATIMQCARRLEDDPEIAFLFVAGGARRDEARAFAVEHGLTRCVFADLVSRNEYPHVLRAADAALACLSPGQTGLSVPSKAYAAMAAGLPLLAVMEPTAEIARVVREERCGVVVEPGDVAGLAAAIRALRADERRRARLGANGARAVEERYNVGAAARRYAEIVSPDGATGRQ